ncbi:hypothetical protein [Streptomyces sp. NP-1717]|uniref:hypothetical protein n=1 Tax=unclassified Streptomyces TaxID=2593676 RepID=UPI001F5C226E|nr:hypothetical protein [Streptomyces sp. NP-1717]MCI3222921.1 hypothetical protein [Streptomyces sp. NP-1717]WTA75440.1 hypothetical protein OG705_22560 [Streptomyces sp. NBC_00838]
MSGHSRKEDEVRRMLDVPHPPVPADLTARATTLGTRILNRRRTWRLLFWTLVTVAVIAFAVWASAVEPWSVPPSDKTPPLEGW